MSEHHTPPSHGDPPAWGQPAAPHSVSPDTSVGGVANPRRGRFSTTTKALTAVGVAAVVAVGGTLAISTASAATTTTSTSTSTTQSTAATAGPNGAPGYGPFNHGTGTGNGFAGRGLRGGPFGLLAGALHGDLVVTASSGSGTTTERLQNGSITAISGSSLTVKSTDGFTATYTVGAGLDLSSLKTGTKVMVIATVNGKSVTATAVVPARTDTSGAGGAPGGWPGGGWPGGGGRGAGPSGAPGSGGPSSGSTASSQPSAPAPTTS